MAKFQSIYSGAEMDDAFGRVLNGTSGIQGVKVNGTSVTPDQENKVNISVPVTSNATFTPALASWVSSGSPSAPQCEYEYRFGYYYKIGRLCHFTFKLKAVSFSTTGYGYLAVSGLPFTSDTTSQYQENCLSIGEYSCINMDDSIRETTPTVTAFIRNNSSQVRFRQNNGANAIDFGSQSLPKSLFISIAGVYLCQS